MHCNCEQGMKWCTSFIHDDLTLARIEGQLFHSIAMDVLSAFSVNRIDVAWAFHAPIHHHVISKSLKCFDCSCSSILASVPFCLLSSCRSECISICAIYSLSRFICLRSSAIRSVWLSGDSSVVGREFAFLRSVSFVHIVTLNLVFCRPCFHSCE